MKSKKIKDTLSKTGYLNELEKHEAIFYIEELENRLSQKDKTIDECIELLEYYYIGNLKYKDSQEAFKKLLEKLNRAKGSG